MTLSEYPHLGIFVLISLCFETGPHRVSADLGPALPVQAGFGTSGDCGDRRQPLPAVWGGKEGGWRGCDGCDP